MISIQGIAILPTKFPDNTSQVWNVPQTLLSNDSLEIKWDFEDESEFLHLAQLQTLLQELKIKTSLNLPYLPYARQDKQVCNTNTFALITFCNLLNSLNFNKITCLDVHSDIAVSLIKNLEVVYADELLSTALKYTKSTVLCYPDKGANQKYSKLENTSYTNLPAVYGSKVRDQNSGHILSYELSGNVSGSSVMIVDDIIDGGATFIKLAELLYQKGAKDVSLFASHGLFSKGKGPLRAAKINNIFVANDLSKEEL